MYMTFIPFERVGIFQLDDDVTKYFNILSEYEYEPADEYGNEYYHFSKNYIDDINSDTHFVEVTNGKIRTVFCYNELIYKNINLIGLTIDEFKKITESDYVGEVDVRDFHENEPPEYVYEFEEIGAQVWTHYGRVVTIIVSGHWSYEED
ncbi:MAG: hypothetical protein J6M05_05875 [Cardiobacteriaceae bacterium]|nr:hypothetical protein [Cardiobacteriaceae bacterium]